ncbi:B12-binding domain-containing radical SAM protein [Chloroflexota bacterium]
MDILLIDPPYVSLKGRSIERGYTVGLTSLAAYLRNADIETAVLMGDLLMDSRSGLIATLLPGVGTNQDANKYAAGQLQYQKIIDDKDHIVWKRLTDIVNQTKPGAVGISYMTPSKHVVERVAGLIRAIDRDIKIIVGSFHPTFCPEEVMQNPDIDFIVGGEGEIPLLGLVKELKKNSPKWETVPGIYYRDSDGQVRNNPGVDLISNLDELPFLARDLVLNCDYAQYRLHGISTARGCPYTCSFCSERRLWGGKVRRRSVNNVIKELKLLDNAYKVNYVDIVDGTFTFDRKYLQEFCNAIINEKLKIKWRCLARYDNLDEGLLKLMKQANCSGMYFGLESGSNRMLKYIDKKITVDKIIEVSKMVYDSGIASATSILIGLPEENKKDMEETLELMKKVKTDIFDVNNYSPLPGTTLYDAMSEEDRNNIDWRKVAFKSFDNHFSKNISNDDFTRYRSEAYKIADNVRIKTIFRLGAKRFFHHIVKIFKS